MASGGREREVSARAWLREARVTELKSLYIAWVRLSMGMIEEAEVEWENGRLTHAI
jgi:hypothetical protein